MNGFVFIASVCALFGLGASSAIPMWEFLSKDEKMSFLYSIFANQVEEFCDSSTMKDCSQQLLKYGLRKLKDMPEEHLDVIDPYQRDANNIIWDSMTEGHDLMQKKMKRRSTTTARPNSYDDQSFGDDLGLKSEASAKIETVYKVLPPKGFVYTRSEYTVGSGTPEFRQPSPTAQYYRSSSYSSNKIQEGTTENIPIIDRYGEYHRIPLTGPMVVKVRLDGTPVEDESSSMPQDEDLRLYNLSKIRLPNF